MDRQQILAAPTVPAADPSCRRLPCRFADREYMIVTYESDPAAVRAAVPEPLVPDPSNQVFCEWIRMPDASGLGAYTESSMVIPCSFKGRPCSFVAQRYLADDPPIAAGRETWSFPKKYAHPRLAIAEDTLTGTLDYAGQRVATATMACKPALHARELARTEASLPTLQCLLKIIPEVDGGPPIAQLVGVELSSVTIKGSWTGPARLDLASHVNAPVADLPARRVVSGWHFVADLTLSARRVLVDYLRNRDLRQAA